MPQLPALPPTAYGTDLTRANFLRDALVEFIPTGKPRGRNDPNEPPRNALLPDQGTSTALPTDFGRMRAVLRNITRSGAQRAGDLTLFGTGSGTVANSTRNEAFNVNVVDTTIDPDTGNTGVQPLGNFDGVAHTHINATTKVRFDADLSGGAHAHKWNGGVIGKAFTAFIGDNQHDVLLLEQIRHLLIEANGHTCTGGFPDQPQNVATAMFVFAKHTPRIWNQLTSAEVEKIDRTMTAIMVTGAFVTSDNNPFVLADTTQYDMQGGVLNRGFNANFSNPPVQNVIYGVLYFGVNRMKEIFAAWDHQDFINRLLGFGMQHVHRTYTSSDPNTPTAAQIDTALHQEYAYFGAFLDDPLGLWIKTVKNLITKTVNSGLNDGLGKQGDTLRGGFMANVIGRRGLPNVGSPLHMFHEFETTDADGSRSAAHYTHDGWYTNLHCHAALVALGYWRVDDNTEDVLDRIEFALVDWLYKVTASLGGGYTDYYKGNGRGVYLFPSDNDDGGRGHYIDFDLQRILDEWHGHDHGFTSTATICKQLVSNGTIFISTETVAINPVTTMTVGGPSTGIRICTPSTIQITSP